MLDYLLTNCIGQVKHRLRIQKFNCRLFELTIGAYFYGLRLSYSMRVVGYTYEVGRYRDTASDSMPKRVEKQRINLHCDGVGNLNRQRYI